YPFNLQGAAPHRAAEEKHTMAQRNPDVRTSVSDWVRGRRGYMAGAVVALVLVVFAVARFAPPADMAVAEAPNEAPSAAAQAAIDSAALAAAVADSVAAAEEVAAAEPEILLANASSEE